MHTRPKDRWREFKKYNREQDEVLPLLDEGKPVFSTEEKSKLMKNVFFGGKNMIGEDLDEEFKTEIDRKVESIQENLNHEKGDNFLNDKIREEETEAAIQLLHKDKAPGTGNIYGKNYFRKGVRHLAKQSMCYLISHGVRK